MLKDDYYMCRKGVNSLFEVLVVGVSRGQRKSEPADFITTKLTWTLSDSIRSHFQLGPFLFSALSISLSVLDLPPESFWPPGPSKSLTAMPPRCPLPFPFPFPLPLPSRWVGGGVRP